ncbi:MAG TPA: TlpA disulfide reductase family protein [Candidatus Thermoplasmatota archaeon]|nr:TlpA disulfide reductase family protein [Candidatus Thermoplasmatota archaeon]
MQPRSFALALALAMGLASVLALSIPSSEEAQFHGYEEVAPPARPVIEAADDTLFEQRYAPHPAAILMPVTFEGDFEVARDYAFLEIFLQYDGILVAGRAFQFRVTDPNGQTVVDFDASGATAMGDSGMWAVHALRNPPLGTYAVEVTISAPVTVALKAKGVTGIAADFALEDALSKGTFEMAKQRGKVVLVDLFATWCGPCKESMPMLASLYGDYARADFEIVSVDVDTEETQDDVRAFMEQNGGTWYAGLDDGAPWRGTVYRSYGNGGGVPTLVLIDPHGVLYFRHSGSDITAAELRALVDEGLARR